MNPLALRVHLAPTVEVIRVAMRSLRGTSIHPLSALEVSVEASPAPVVRRLLVATLVVLASLGLLVQPAVAQNPNLPAQPQQWVDTTYVPPTGTSWTPMTSAA